MVPGRGLGMAGARPCGRQPAAHVASWLDSASSGDEPAAPDQLPGHAAAGEPSLAVAGGSETAVNVRWGRIEQKSSCRERSHSTAPHDMPVND